MVESTYPKWRRFRELLEAAGGRVVTPEAGGSSTALGFSNLALAFLTVDECERHLAHRGDLTLLMWVNTSEGAAHAIQFAHAALAGYRTLEVKELSRERPKPARCPHCGMLTVTGNTASQRGAYTTVECEHCGEVLDKIRTGPNNWSGSVACEGDDAQHLGCTSLSCGCGCHQLGRSSQEVGITALWNADMATASPDSAPRGDWYVLVAGAVRRRPKEFARKSA